MDGKFKYVINIMGAMECAKEALELLPPLPLNMKPAYIRVLDAIYKLGDDSRSLRVSDISKDCGLLLPNTTKIVNEMVDLNIVRKITSSSDKRVVLVKTTELGDQYIQEYVHHFVEGLEEEFSKLNEMDCLVMTETISKVYQAMKRVYQERDVENVQS